VTMVAWSASSFLSEQPGFRCQGGALLVSKAQPPVSELNTHNPVLFAQILDGMLLLLIHPASQRNEQKAKWAQRLWHRFSRLPSPVSTDPATALAYCFQTDPVFEYYG
jgi:hypothetical protein